MDKFEINYDAMIQEIKDDLTLKLLKLSIPDSPDKDVVIKAIGIFVKHGIPVTTALDIFTELNVLFPKKEGSDDRSKGNT